MEQEKASLPDCNKCEKLSVAKIKPVHTVDESTSATSPGSKKRSIQGTEKVTSILKQAKPTAIQRIVLDKGKYDCF